MAITRIPNDNDDDMIIGIHHPLTVSINKAASGGTMNMPVVPNVFIRPIAEPVFSGFSNLDGVEKTIGGMNAEKTPSNKAPIAQLHLLIQSNWKATTIASELTTSRKSLDAFLSIISPIIGVIRRGGIMRNAGPETAINRRNSCEMPI